jgi:hypothetical protein
MHQTTADTLHTCNSIKQHLRNTQRTIEDARLRIERSEARLDASIGNLLTCEMTRGIVPKNPIYRLLLAPSR